MNNSDPRKPGESEGGGTPRPDNTTPPDELEKTPGDFIDDDEDGLEFEDEEEEDDD